MFPQRFSVPPCLCREKPFITTLLRREDHLLRVGLTGGIASGKSVVGEMFVALGAKLIQADQIAHELMQPGQAVYDEVVRCFGSGILNAAGSVNRARLAEVAFGQSRESSRVEDL